LSRIDVRTLLVPLVLLGCSIPLGRGPDGDREILLGYTATNASRGQIHRIVIGVDTGIAVASRGLVLGVSDVRVLTPIGDETTRAPGVHAPCGYAPPLGLECTTSAGTTRRVGLVVTSYALERLRTSRTGFLHSRYFGASGRLGDFLQGANVGFTEATVLWAPRDREVELDLNYRSREIEGSSLVHRERSRSR